VKIELLYFNGCPSWQTGLEELKTALRMEHLDDSVELVKVKNNFEAARRKFLGSPSFRVDGQELWPEQCDSYSLSCRLYSTPEGLKGNPTVGMLRKALRKFIQV
jgi:hypothetical protein